jgi:hypothetical protein
MACLTPLIAPNAPADPNGGEAHRRVEPRSNIFVVAALASAQGTGPVRIRNMSRSGALIEGPVIPPTRSAIRLSRGSLGVAGEIIWRRDNRAGVRFECAVAVAEWLPGGNRSSGQQRIDEIVYSYKAEVGAMSHASAASIEAPVERPDVVRELLELQAALNAVAEELVSDAAATERHPNALQAIDMTAQKLEALARQLGASSPS